MVNYTNKALYKKIQKMEGEVELKYKDYNESFGDLDLGNWSTVRALNMVGTGIDARGRVGEMVKGTSLKYNFVVTYRPNSTIASNCFVRILIFYDREPGGNAPQIAPGGAGVLDPLSSQNAFTYKYNLTGMESRFKILRDITVNLKVPYSAVNVSDEAQSATVTQIHNGKIKLNRKTYYSASGADLASLETNGIFVTFEYMAPDTIVNDADTLALDWSSRFYFKDA